MGGNTEGRELDIVAEILQNPEYKVHHFNQVEILQL